MVGNEASRFFCLRDGTCKTGQKRASAPPCRRKLPLRFDEFSAPQIPFRLGHTQVHVFARCFQPNQARFPKGPQRSGGIVQMKEALGLGRFPDGWRGGSPHTSEPVLVRQEVQGLAVGRPRGESAPGCLVRECYPLPFVPATWQFAYGDLAIAGTSTTVERDPAEIGRNAHSLYVAVDSVRDGESTRALLCGWIDGFPFGLR